MDLMPKVRLDEEVLRGWRRVLGRRYGGGSWMAIVMAVLGDILEVAEKVSL